jgi:hypothetical protein
MAFVAGLNNAAVTRLRHTRAELPARLSKARDQRPRPSSPPPLCLSLLTAWLVAGPQRLDELEALMSAEGSFKAYRAEVLRSAPPIIPYMYVGA